MGRSNLKRLLAKATYDTPKLNKRLCTLTRSWEEVCKILNANVNKSRKKR